MKSALRITEEPNGLTHDDTLEVLLRLARSPLAQSSSAAAVTLLTRALEANAEAMVQGGSEAAVLFVRLNNEQSQN